MRTILHVDMDAFYASVEQHRRPELRGRPVIVGGSGRRGVVAAASYEARAYGVRSAMPSLRARRLCPDAVFLPGDHAFYATVSARVMEVFRSKTPLVEPLSLDEAFLDVTGSRRLHGDGPTIAAAIRTEVLAGVGLTCSVGVAANKFVAKLATEQAKPKPSRSGPRPGAGVTVVAPGTEAAFLRPLPVHAVWGVGPRTLEKLQRLGITTIGDLEAAPPSALTAALGESQGRHLSRLAHGVDDRPVESHQEPKSISHEETFAEDVHLRDRLHTELVRMADAVARRARGHGVGGRTITIKVRFGDFRTISRSVTLSEATDTGPGIARAASALLDAVDVSSGVRLLGVGLTNLRRDAPRQLTLDDLAGAPTDAHAGTGAQSPESGSDPGSGRPGRRPRADGPAWTAVTATVDAVRDRFGDDALVPAALASGRSLRTKRTSDQPWGPDDEPDRGG